MIVGDLSMKFLVNPRPVKRIKRFVNHLKKYLHSRTIRSLQSPSTISMIQRLVRNFIQRTIYDAYTPRGYNRTMNLLNSFKAEAISDNPKGYAVYSDPSVATPEGANKKMSYAAYFEMPEELNTFIKPAGQQSYPVNYRPFYEYMKVVLDFNNDKYIEDAIHKAIKETFERTS